MMLLAQSEGMIGERLECHLDQVEARFAEELRSDLDCVNTLTRHVERYRGKMLRPTLVLISAMTRGQEALTEPSTQAGPCGSLHPNGSEAGETGRTCCSSVDAGPDPSTAAAQPHHILGTVVEMVHMATLVHDDILDEAEMRRGGATLNHLSGNEAAVMLGDYLISHAYHLCSTLGRSDVSRQIAQATNTICEGELLQLANRNNWQLDEQTYFEIIRRKTARLCGTCCRLGADLTGSEPEADHVWRHGSRPRDLSEQGTDGTQPDPAQALHIYGSKLGMGFQIVDDLLDLTGDPETVGKTLGRDLEKGKITLPLIRYLDQATPAQRTRTLSWLRDQADGKYGSPGALSRERAAGDLQKRLMDTEALAYAKSWAGQLIQEAKAALYGALAPSPARRTMLEMADAVLERNG